MIKRARSGSGHLPREPLQSTGLHTSKPGKLTDLSLVALAGHFWIFSTTRFQTAPQRTKAHVAAERPTNQGGAEKQSDG